MAHPWDPTPSGGGSKIRIRGSGLSQLHNEFQASLGYMNALSTKQTQGWGDSLVGQVLAVQAYGLGLNCQSVYIASPAGWSGPHAPLREADTELSAGPWTSYLAYAVVNYKDSEGRGYHPLLGTLQLAALGHSGPHNTQTRIHLFLGLSVTSSGSSEGRRAPCLENLYFLPRAVGASGAATTEAYGACCLGRGSL